MNRFSLFLSLLFCISIFFRIGTEKGHAKECSIEEKPLIRTKIIQNNTIYFHLSLSFTQKYAKQSLRLSYPQEVDLNNLPSSIIEVPLITNVIAVIWLSGEVYVIEEMDEDLYYSLIKIKEFFKRFFYNTSWEGELRPKRLVKNIPPKRNHQPAALFTGGLDSTTTVFRHLDENPILISFNEPHIHSIAFANEYHLDLHPIQMNYNDFLKLTTLDKASPDISKWFWDTSMGLAWVGGATPLLYSLGISQLYIPSGFNWRAFIFPDGQTIRQPASPLIDNNLSPMGLQVKHDPFTMTRTDKMKFISTFCSTRNLSKPQFIVCNHHRWADHAYLNCNQCMKCQMTMLDILAIGENLQDYGFTLTEEEFITQFQEYFKNLRLRRGGTYTICNDTQSYLKKNIAILPSIYHPFYEWFISLDLWAMIDESSNRPPRKTPFNWNDYRDLYPGVESFID